MYEIVRDVAPPAAEPADPDTSGPLPIVVAMRENRSTLSPEARGAVAALVFALMAAGILPVLKGLLFVPVAAMAGLALLTFALDWHARSTPASEVLEISAGSVRHRDARGRETAIPLGRVRLRTIGNGDQGLRLFVEAHHTRIEIGRCLGLAERQEVAALVGDTFAQLQRHCRAVPLWA